MGPASTNKIQNDAKIMHVKLVFPSPQPKAPMPKLLVLLCHNNQYVPITLKKKLTMRIG